MKFAVLFVLLCLSLGACGQKGPLFLPQPNKPEATAPQTEPVPPKAEQSQTEQAQAEQPPAEPAAINPPATPAE